MKAAGKFLQIEVKGKKGGFQEADSSVLEGTILSVGGSVEHMKKGYEVLFPATHGKVMEHTIGGKKYYFVDESVILSYEK